VEKYLSCGPQEGAELYGKVLRCSLAKQITKVANGKAIWSEEEFLQNSLQEDDAVTGGDEDA
jgi:hypothetical protein